MAYEDEIRDYSCTQLATEKTFQEAIKSRYTAEKSNANPVGDVAIGVLTFGMANIGSNRSDFTSSNYNKAILDADTKIGILEQKITGCT